MVDIMNPDTFAVRPAKGPVGDAVTDLIKNSPFSQRDGVSNVPGAPPLWGEDVMPHVMSFNSLVGTYARAYSQSDEALQDSWDNARKMRNDLGIMECLEARQRMTAQLEWSIEPEDDKHFGQLSLANELERMIRRMRRFTEYKRNLMEGIWFGKYAIQNKYRWSNVNSRQRLIPSSPVADHPGWIPIHGDKLVFRYDDGNLKPTLGEYEHQMGIRTNIWNGWQNKQVHRTNDIQPTGESMVKFLTPLERSVIVCHKHMIEDADYHDPEFAGSIHGVGIRSRVYWEYTLKQETLAFLMEYMERSAGGIEVWTYPSGDNEALKSIKEAANRRMANGRNQLFFPKPLGDDAASYNLEIVEPGFAGMDLLKNLIEEYFGHRIKRYILGQTLSSEASATGLGSGVAEAHLDTLGQIIQYDAYNLEDTLTYDLIRVMKQINFPETCGWHMKMKLETQSEDARETLEAYQLAYNMGASIPEKDVMHSIGLGMPNADEKLLSQSQQMAGGMDIPMGIPKDGDGDGIAGEGGMNMLAEQASYIQQYSRNSEHREAAKHLLWRAKQWNQATDSNHRNELRKGLKPLRKVLRQAFADEHSERVRKAGKSFRVPDLS